MTAINQNQLVDKLPNLNIPFDFNPTPWKNFVGENFVAPVVPKDNCNAFLPYNVRSLKEEEYNGEGLYEFSGLGDADYAQLQVGLDWHHVWLCGPLSVVTF